MLNQNINSCGLSLYSSDRNCSLAWCFSKQTVLFTWGDDVIFDIANSNIIDIDYWSRSITHFSIMKLYKNNNPSIIISAIQVCHHLLYFFASLDFELSVSQQTKLGGSTFLIKTIKQHNIHSHLVRHSAFFILILFQCSYFNENFC